jgi:hypothetical protein
MPKYNTLHEMAAAPPATLMDCPVMPNAPPPPLIPLAVQRFLDHA